MAKAKRAPAVAKPAGVYHHGDLRRALIDAAVALIQKEGPRALSLRAAARLAGVSQTAPYRHFDDKEALLAAVAEDGMRGLVLAMQQASAPHTRAADAGRKMQALGLAYARFAAAHPSHFRVMFGSEVADKARYPALLAASDEAFGLLREGVLGCQRERLVRDGDPREIALAAWSIVHGFASLAVDGQLGLVGLEEGSHDELARRMTALLFTGIGRGKASS